MTGHAMPWNRDPSGQQKEDATTARTLAKKQTDLATQQEKEISQRKKKLNQQQVAMLRSRYGASSAASGGANSPQPMTDTAASLFNNITGG